MVGLMLKWWAVVFLVFNVAKAADNTKVLSPIRTIDFGSTIQDVHWCPDNSCFAVLTDITTVVFYDVDSFKMIGTVVDTTGIYDFEFSPNGEYLITEGGLSTQGEYKVWDTTTLTNVITIDQSYETRFYDFDELNDAFFAVDEDLIKTYIWKLSTGELVSIEDHVVTSSHNNKYWVAGREGSIELLTPWTMEVKATLNVPAYIVEWNRIDDSSVMLITPDVVQFWEYPFDAMNQLIGTNNGNNVGFLNSKNHFLYWNDENFEFIDTKNSENSFELEIGKQVRWETSLRDIDEAITSTPDDSIIAIDYTPNLECYSSCVFETAVWNTKSQTLISTMQHGVSDNPNTRLINEKLAISIFDAYRLVLWDPKLGTGLFQLPHQTDHSIFLQRIAFELSQQKNKLISWSDLKVYIWELP